MFRRVLAWTGTTLKRMGIHYMLVLLLFTAIAGLLWRLSGGPSISVTPPVRNHLTDSLEHYHGQRNGGIAVPDAVEAFIINASPVLKQTAESANCTVSPQPEPVKNEPQPQPPRRIFRRR